MQTQTIKIKTAFSPPKTTLPKVQPYLPEDWKASFKKIKLSAAIAVAIYYPKIRKNFTRIFIALLMFDLIAGAYDMQKIFSRPSDREQSRIEALLSPLIPTTQASSQKINVENNSVKEFTSSLSAQGLVIDYSRQTTDPNISAPGTMLGIGGDTISVYKYANAKIAEKEAQNLSAKYASSAKQNVWYQQTRLYLHDSLLIIYLGSRSDIVNAISNGSKPV